MIHSKTKKRKIKKKLIIIFIMMTSIKANAIDNIKGDMKVYNSYQLIHDHLSRIHSVDKYKNAINAQNRKQELPDILLTPGERRSIILQDFAQRHGESNEILTRHAVQDLHLLSGTQYNPEQSLLASIGSPITVAGEIMLAKILISPITDVPVLRKRQQALQYLTDHPKLIFKLEERLIHYAADEDGLIALLDPSDALNSPIFNDIDKQTHLPGLTSSSTREEISRRLKDVANTMGTLNAPLLLLGSTFYKALDLNNGILLGVLNALACLPSNMDTAITYYLRKYFYSPITSEKIYTASSFTMLQMIAIYKFYQNFRDNKSAYSFIMERSRRPGRALESARQLKWLLHYHPILEDIMEYCSDFLKFHNSSQMQEIIMLLQDAPEKTPATLAYIFTNMGRYKRSLMLLRRNHRSLVRIMRATGEVDAWLTVAKLLRSSSYRDKNPFSFPQYETESERPMLQLQNFWSPLLSPAVAVPSNLSAGYEAPQNTIITGPNAAGKSTAIDGIALNVILAQTLGIAAATSFKLTPFAFIHTHMNIEPDIISGSSSFNAESKRAIRLLQKLRELSHNQYSITFLDEIFSNTTPREGELGALAYLKAMGGSVQAMSISSTYYSRLEFLADKYPLTFQNFHVSAEVNSDGQLHYDYILKPGFSTQNVAFNILEQEGIQQEFLDIIQDIIDHPEYYTPE